MGPIRSLLKHLHVREETSTHLGRNQGFKSNPWKQSEKWASDNGAINPLSLRERPCLPKITGDVGFHQTSLQNSLAYPEMIKGACTKLNHMPSLACWTLRTSPKATSDSSLNLNLYSA